MLTAHKMEELIGLTLLFGTLASLMLVIVGGGWFLLQHGGENLQTELMQINNQPVTIQQIWLNALSFTPLGIVELGLLLLVVTQIIRIALLVWFYAAVRDIGFTLISIFILLILVYSFIWRD